MNDISGEKSWSKSKIESIIKTKTYTGKVSWGRRSNRTFNSSSDSLVCSDYDENLEIIDSESWDRAQKIRLKKDKIKDSKYFSTDFLLRDKLVCARCNNKMKAKNYGKYRDGTQREGVYRCDCTKHLENRDKMIFKKSIIENKFINNLIGILKKESIAELWYHYSKTKEKVIKENQAKIKLIEDEVNKKETQLKDISKLLDDNSNETIFQALEFQRIIISNEIDLLKSYKKDLDNSSNNFFNDESQLKSALLKLFKVDFDTISNERKRIIIDMLIDKILVDKVLKKSKNSSFQPDYDEDYNLEMQIYSTTNIDIL